MKEILEEENIKTENGKLKNFLYINSAKNIEGKKSFQEGLYTIQDEVASLPSKILNPKSNEKVLDACCAPGGKTTFLAELMKNEGEIIAWDLHKHRLKLVEDTAKRLGVTNIKLEQNDATIYKEKYKNYFDKILLDVPCMGLGVLKRKPDIKWSKTIKDIEEIKKLQKEILETCSQYLKNGGELVYSTCSVLKSENEDIVENFLKNHEKFTIKKLENFMPDENNDGFFIAKLKKVE